MRLVLLVVAIGVSLLVSGCSSGPAPPQPGTPPFIWGAAQTTYKAGDFLKASDNFTQVTKSENEFTAKALPLAIVLNCGIAEGYNELADNFDIGAKTNRANPTPFRKQAQMCRVGATAASLQAAELAHKLMASEAGKAEKIPFELDYPSGSPSEPVQLQRVAKGMLFPDAEIESLQKAMVQRGVLLAVTRATGSGDDTAKALENFKKGPVTVDRAVFYLTLAKSLQEQAELFGPKKLDTPNRAKMLYNEAEGALKLAPDGKDKKEIQGKIDKAMKAMKST